MNGVTEEGVIVGLLQSCINSFRSDILECVHHFYREVYDPNRSLDKGYILDLIEIVHKGLKEIKSEVL